MGSPNDGVRSGRTCKYKFSSLGSKKCTYDVPNGLETHGYCILHADFPENPEESNRLAKLKACEINRRITEPNPDYNFEGAKLPGIILSSQKLRHGNLNLQRAEIKGDALFIKTEMPGSILFGGAVIDGIVDFSGAKIGGSILFGAIDSEAEAKEDKRHREEDIQAENTKRKLKERRQALREKGKDVTLMCGKTFIPPGDVGGRISFRDVLFVYPDAQLEALRAGKIACERVGDRGNEDYHFYQETKALHQIASKTPGTSRLRRLVNWGARNILGYGVSLKQLLFAWFILIMVSFVAHVLMILLGQGIVDMVNIFKAAALSLLMAGIPGAWNPDPNSYLMISTFVEAIVGTVLWFALLAVMARKYLK